MKNLKSINKNCIFPGTMSLQYYNIIAMIMVNNNNNSKDNLVLYSKKES